MFCPKCGAQIPDDATFCPKCGHRFDDASVPASGSTQSPLPVYQAARAYRHVPSTGPGLVSLMSVPGRAQKVFAGAVAIVMLMLMLDWISLNTSQFMQFLLAYGTWTDAATAKTELAAYAGTFSIPGAQSLLSLTSASINAAMASASASSLSALMAAALTPAINGISSAAGMMTFELFLWYLSVIGVAIAGVSIFRRGLDAATCKIGAVGFLLPAIAALVVIIGVGNVDGSLSSAVDSLSGQLSYSSDVQQQAQLLKSAVQGLLTVTPWVWVTLVISLLACGYCAWAAFSARPARVG